MSIVSPQVMFVLGMVPVLRTLNSRPSFGERVRIPRTCSVVLSHSRTYLIAHTTPRIAGKRRTRNPNAFLRIFLI
jgi:hypothetical protein